MRSLPASCEKSRLFDYVRLINDPKGIYDLDWKILDKFGNYKLIKTLKFGFCTLKLFIENREFDSIGT